MSRDGAPGCRALAAVGLAAALFAAPVVGPVAAEDTRDAREGRGSIRQMQRLSAEQGWALTDRALLFTSDGGSSWSEMATGRLFEGSTNAFLLSASKAWLAGVSFDSPGMLILLDTTNGGTSWRKQVIETSELDSGQTYTDARAFFLDAMHGWLSGRVATSSAFSGAVLLRTSDGGESWERLPSPPSAGPFVFVDAHRGFMAGAPVSERFYRTVDGGRSWEELDLALPVEQGMALYGLPVFHSSMLGTLEATLRGDTPQLLTLTTRDGGRSWMPTASTALPPGDYDNPVPGVLAERFRPGGIPLTTVESVSLAADGSAWALVAEGDCDEGVCRQVTRLVTYDEPVPFAQWSGDLLVRTREGPQIEFLPRTRVEKTAISLDLGFDKCAAGTTAQMQAWWDHSPYRDANIYFGGSARACSQIHLDAAWIEAVFDQGWELIPTWVGPQAPCTGYTRRISSDPTQARRDALAEADAAVAAAEALGLGKGAPLYYDVEYYDENDRACSAAMREFINAWTERTNELGYLAGAYGNARNINNDWIPGVIANPPDAVWLVPWVCGRTSSCNWTPTVFGVPGLDDSYWPGYRRIRQYWGPHTESYGGVTFEIDGDYANGPVASASDAPSCWEVVPNDRWQGEYFDNPDLTGSAAMVRDDGDAGLDFDWGSGSPGASCGVPADGFSIRWTRTTFFDGGTYRFTVSADDGVQLTLDGEIAIDEWSAQPPATFSVLVTLEGGTHTIGLRYFGASGQASAGLSWKRVSNVRRTRPTTRVRPVGRDR